MTIFRSDAPPPEWCEVEHFEVLELEPQRRVSVPCRSPKERTLIASGYCQVVVGGRSQVLREGQFFDLEYEVGWTFCAANVPCTLVLFCGHWGAELGGCGLFSVRSSAERGVVKGDPVAYPKRTGFDAHYHDCDEYWVVLRGVGTVVIGGRHSTVGPGDAIATGTGHHHDFPEVQEPVHAVYFETTLEGQKRIGHLWEHTHGTARPKPDRI